MNAWHPTHEEIDLIKKCAVLESSPGLSLSQIELDVGLNGNIDDEGVEHSINMALVSLNDEYSDLELKDTVSFSVFENGVELNDDDYAVVDFYIRGSNPDAGLHGNIVVIYAVGRIDTVIGGTNPDTCLLGAAKGLE